MYIRNNNNYDNAYGAVIAAENHCESSPGSYDECGTAPSGRRPQTGSNDAGCESASRLPEATPTSHRRHFIISQLQLGTGKTAGWLSGCPGVWLVGKSCLSVCPRYV